MPYFDYYEKSNPTVDPYIKTIQEKLNYIRISHKTLNKGYDGKSYNWKHLSVDGQYGHQTAEAVKAFQIYRGITPASGILGPTTARFIEEAYNKGGVSNEYVRDIQKKLNHVCKLNITVDGLWGQETIGAVRLFRYTHGLSNRSFSPNGELDAETMQRLNQEYRKLTQKTQVDHFNIESIASDIVNFLYNLAEVPEVFMAEIRNMKNPTPTSVFRTFFKNILESKDCQLNRLKKNIQQYLAYKEGNSVDKRTLEASKRPINTSNGIDWGAQKAQQKVSNANSNARMTNNTLKNIQRAKQEMLNTLQRYNISERVNALMKKTLKNPPRFNGPKAKMGGVLGYLWSLKDVIADVIKIYCVIVGSMTFEEWLANFKKHFFEALDGIIIGVIATFIAEAVAAGLVTAGVVSAPVLVIAIIVLVFSMIIGWIISWLLDNAGISFSRFVFEELPKVYFTPILQLSLA